MHGEGLEGGSVQSKGFGCLSKINAFGDLSFELCLKAFAPFVEEAALFVRLVVVGKLGLDGLELRDFGVNPAFVEEHGKATIDGIGIGIVAVASKFESRLQEI